MPCQLRWDEMPQTEAVDADTSRGFENVMSWKDSGLWGSAPNVGNLLGAPEQHARLLSSATPVC